jgi:hypothetical protein
MTKQIPIVCPGHTRPSAELQFCSQLQQSFNVTNIDFYIHLRKYVLHIYIYLFMCETIIISKSIHSLFLVFLALLTTNTSENI